MNRSLASSWSPRSAARWISRCASKVLERSEVSRWKSRPSPAAAWVTDATAASAWSSGMPYFVAISSAWAGPSPAACADSVVGSSSKLRHSTSTSSRCANCASADSKRRFPM